MAIDTTAGFKPFTQEPIDDRMIANNYDALLAIPSNRRYPGMRVYVLDLPTGTNRKYYELKGSVNVNPTHNDNWEAVTSAVVNAVVDCGNWDPSTGAFPTTGGTGTGGAIKQGNLFYVSVAGAHLGIEYNIGDSIRARIDNATNDNNDWRVLEGNIGFVPENVARKRTTLSSPNDTEYPTTKAVKDALDLKANDNEVVKLTGNQTISGIKEFSSGLIAFRGIGTAITTTSYTLALTDQNRFLESSNAANQTIIIPLNSSVAFAIGTEIEICRAGVGDVTISPDAGVTLKSAGNRYRISEIYGVITLKKVGVDTWIMIGGTKS